MTISTIRTSGRSRTAGFSLTELIIGSSISVIILTGVLSAFLMLSRSGMVLGSIVAKTIDMNGGTDFHYDEALGRLGIGNPFGIAKWRELQSAADRNAYSTELNF